MKINWIARSASVVGLGLALSLAPVGVSPVRAAVPCSKEYRAEINQLMREIEQLDRWHQMHAGESYLFPRSSNQNNPIPVVTIAGCLMAGALVPLSGGLSLSTCLGSAGIDLLLSASTPINKFETMGPNQKDKVKAIEQSIDARMVRRIELYSVYRFLFEGVWDAQVNGHIRFKPSEETLLKTFADRLNEDPKTGVTPIHFTEVKYALNELKPFYRESARGCGQGQFLSLNELVVQVAHRVMAAKGLEYLPFDSQN